MAKIIENIKFIVAILGFILIIYPVRVFIYPFLKFIIDNAYMFGMFFVMYMGLYLYDYDISRIINDIFAKLFANDLSAINWFMSPLVIVGGYPIPHTSPGDIILGILIGILIIKIYQILYLFGNKLKQIFGDVLLVVLWLYYTVAGEKQKSVMLITANEAKTKIYMYIVIGIAIILSVAITILPQLMMSSVHSVNTTAPILINNTTVDMSYLQWVIP